MSRYDLTVRDKSEIAEGSLSDIVVQENISLAEAFANAKRVILLDGLSSMSASDVNMDGYVTRHDAAETQVRRLQKEYKGQVALFCFSDDIKFCPDGVPRRQGGLTAMGSALGYIKAADDMGIGIDLITDGEPTDGEEFTLKIARTFKTPVNGIYIGPEGGGGYEFVKQLSRATGGHAIKSKNVGIFYEEERALLLGSG